MIQLSTRNFCNFSVVGASLCFFVMNKSRINGKLGKINGIVIFVIFILRMYLYAS